MANVYLAGDWDHPSRTYELLLDTLSREGHAVVDARQLELGPHERPHLVASPAELAAVLPWGRDERELIAAQDYLILIVPSGRDAHADFGYAAAVGVTTVVYMAAPTKGKAVYAWADEVVASLAELLQNLDVNLRPDMGEIEDVAT